MGFQLLKRGLLLGRMAVNTADSIARLEARNWHMHVVDLHVLVCVKFHADMATQTQAQRLDSLRQVINAAAAEAAAAGHQVPEDDLSLLDEQELQVLVNKKLFSKTVLSNTTYEHLVSQTVGVSPGAATVLKLLFPGPITSELAPCFTRLAYSLCHLAHT
jgi:hypothetical protein